MPIRQLARQLLPRSYASGLKSIKPLQGVELGGKKLRVDWKFMGLMVIISVVLGIVVAVITAAAVPKVSREFDEQFRLEMEKAIREGQKNQ